MCSPHIQPLCSRYLKRWISGGGGTLVINVRCVQEISAILPNATRYTCLFILFYVFYSFFFLSSMYIHSSLETFRSLFCSEFMRKSVHRSVGKTSSKYTVGKSKERSGEKKNVNLTLKRDYFSRKKEKRTSYILNDVIL